MRIKERTERSTSFGTKSRLANAKSSMLRDSNADARMYEIHGRTGRKRRLSVVSYEDQN